MSSLSNKTEIDSVPKVGTVQRRQERLRKKLFEVAGQLFEENGGEEGRGFEDTTVEQIAQRADISPRTFFRIFESKIDVIYLDMRKSMAEYFAFLEVRLSERLDPMSASILARLDQIQHFVEDDGNLRRLRRSLQSPHFVARRAAWYAEWQARLRQELLPYMGNSADAELKASLIAATVVKVGEVGLLAWSEAKGKDRPESWIARAFLSLNEILDIDRSQIEEYVDRPSAARRPKR